MLSNLQDLKARFVLNADHYTKWKSLGRENVTAMDAAALASENSIDTIMRRKYSDYVVENKAVDWGKEREPIILEQLGLTQNRDMFRARENESFLAMPDAIFEKDDQLAICQVKTTVKDFKKIPKAYLRQVQWETLVAGASGCLFVWEVHQNYKVIDLKSVWIERNEEMVNHLLPLADDLLKVLRKAQVDPWVRSRYQQTYSSRWY
jgi:hypothetical protein